jgi:endonuclease YncB( thermonuclease family)
VAVPRYTLIRGEFYILYPDLPLNGPEPDGDTINFLPDNDDLVPALPRFSGVRPDRKHLGTYGVRFEGIDTLETHFQNQHQNLEFAQAARGQMLDHVGFDTVEFFADRPNKVQAASPHPLPGYLLANGIESNGRVLALVSPGLPDLDAADGDRVFVDEALLERSVNAQLVRDGLAYAELYSTMPIAYITRMRDLVAAARAGDAGFWPREDLTLDNPISPARLADLEPLVMFPKLYRRLVAYFRAGNTDLAGFDQWIRADPVRRDDRLLLPTGELGNLHDLYTVGPGGLTLTHLPEQVMFDPDPTAPVPTR